MRRICVSVFVLLLFVNAASASHSVRRRGLRPGHKWNLTAIIGTRLTVSPSWFLAVGDTAEINCTAHNDKHNFSDKIDLQLTWTRMGPGDRTKTVLVSRKASEGIHYILGPVTHEHQGMYSCDDEGSQLVYVHDWHQLIWVADADGSQRASIDVISHNRSQFFNGENFTVSCRLPDGETRWTMMRSDTFDGNMTECPNQESSGNQILCHVRSEFPWTYSLYWCESPTGERSNGINITTTAGVWTALESPTRPVPEGQNVTIDCIFYDRKTKTITSDFRKVYYKNGRWLGYIYGNWTLTSVTKADEGRYKCRHPDDGMSHDAWISVTARRPEDED